MARSMMVKLICQKHHFKFNQSVVMVMGNRQEATAGLMAMVSQHVVAVLHQLLMHN